MDRNAPQSWVREISIAVIGGLLSTVLAALVIACCGLDKTDHAKANTPQSPVDAPRVPPAQQPPQPTAGCLNLLFNEDLPDFVDVLLQGHRVVARDAGPRVLVIDNLMAGDCQVTIRAGDRQFHDVARILAGMTTTIQVRLPAVRPTVKPPVTPPVPATGTLVLDLPHDVCAETEVTLNGERHVPAFKARRVLGFVVPAGVCDVRVRHRSREFACPVIVRAAAHISVTVAFPRVRLLLEFIEDVPAGVQVWLGGVLLEPTSRGRRCCEFAVDPGTHTVIVCAGDREFHTTVVLDKDKTPPIAVDLGRKRTPPVKVSLARPKEPATHSPATPIYTFPDVWRGSARLCNRRVRVSGWGIIYSLDDRFLFRYRENKEDIVNCHISLRDIGPLAGEVAHGKSLVVTLEGEVSGSAGRVVTMKNCRVICVEP